MENIIVNLFKDDFEYIKENRINKEMLLAKLYSYDETFLKKILNNPTLKDNFTKNIDGIYLFKTNDFVTFLTNSDLTIENKTLKEGFSYNFYENKHRL